MSTIGIYTQCPSACETASFESTIPAVRHLPPLSIRLGRSLARTEGAERTPNSPLRSPIRDIRVKQQYLRTLLTPDQDHLVPDGPKTQNQTNLSPSQKGTPMGHIQCYNKKQTTFFTWLPRLGEIVHHEAQTKPQPIRCHAALEVRPPCPTVSSHCRPPGHSGHSRHHSNPSLRLGDRSSQERVEPQGYGVLARNLVSECPGGRCLRLSSPLQLLVEGPDVFISKMVSMIIASESDVVVNTASKHNKENRGIRPKYGVYV